MNESNRIGTPEQANMVVQRILCAVYLQHMHELLAEAQACIDKFKGTRNG